MWYKFEDKLPTDIVGKQVKILFYSHGWASFRVGLYENYGHTSGWLSVYDPIPDRYFEWGYDLPTYWTYEPKLPTKSLFQVGEDVLCLDEVVTVIDVNIRFSGETEYVIEDSTGTQRYEMESYLEKITEV